MDVQDVLADLIAEQAALDDVMSSLSDEQWVLPTPSPRWSVADQIGHLTYFDATAAQAITDPDGFAAGLADAIGAMSKTPDDADAFSLGEYRAMAPAELLDAWRTNRSKLGEAAKSLANDTRIPWYGPSMGAKSFLTARLMEAWAHGQDIVDTVGATRPPTDRIKHIAQLGFITRGWSYINRGLEAPESPVKVELNSPSGDTWLFGDESADQSIFGPAEDFAMVVTQRRHVDTTNLTVLGEDARDWMLKSQAFAGAATEGPSAL